MDVITIGLPDGFANQEVAALYDQLWTLESHGKKPITGHTTTKGEMAIMNFSEMETTSLKASIDRCLANAYPTDVKKVYTVAVESHSGYDAGRRVWPIASAKASFPGGRRPRSCATCSQIVW